MNAKDIVEALTSGPSFKSVDHLIHQLADRCEKAADPNAALAKAKPVFVKVACVCARLVANKLEKGRRASRMKALKAAEAWILNPTPENEFRARRAKDATADGSYIITNPSNQAASAASSACWYAARCAEDTADAAAYNAKMCAEYAYMADRTIDFGARVAPYIANALADML